MDTFPQLGEFIEQFGGMIEQYGTEELASAVEIATETLGVEGGEMVVLTECVLESAVCGGLVSSLKVHGTSPMFLIEHAFFASMNATRICIYFESAILAGKSIYSVNRKMPLAQRRRAADCRARKSIGLVTGNGVGSFFGMLAGRKFGFLVGGFIGAVIGSTWFGFGHLAKGESGHHSRSPTAISKHVSHGHHYSRRKVIWSFHQRPHHFVC
mmetsp:Transcript_23132/g.38059  ORF Transcript_23132/g.38059 Transcript_23132/m.38059 type:complete len:212 (+) Transcript_23132:287-922(+)